LMEEMDKRVARAGDHIAELTSTLAEVGADIKEATTELSDRMKGGGIPSGEQFHGTPEPSYAGAARAALSMPERAVIRNAADRESIRARQVLVDNLTIACTDGSSLTEAVAKANAAIPNMESEELDVPRGLRFTAARFLRNGGTVFELATAEMAEWIREHADEFARWLGAGAKLKLRLFKVIAEFVPVALDPTDVKVWRDAEEELGLPPNAVVGARWIKPIERRRKDQKVAFLMIDFSDRDAGNVAMSQGLSLAGKRVTLHRCYNEPLRCARCHKYGVGHLARDCPQKGEICGTC
ncbi:hypothetical protein LXA43DRAFT_870354, partial [Ganoderma leucocontextum]